MALDAGGSVQAVDYPKLKEKLLAKGQVLEWTGPRRSASRSVSPRSLPGIVVDAEQARRTGSWIRSTAKGSFVGSSYLHDNNEAQGEKSVRFEAKLPHDGLYSVRLAYAANGNRATNVLVIVHHADGTSELLVNQRQTAPIGDLFIELGEFPFRQSQPAVVEVKNDRADGHVIADAVQWLPVEP